MTAIEARRVLIATVAVLTPAGTDRYTRDLALALLRRGWLPIVYTTQIGPIAEELRQATVPVIDNLDKIGGRPDVIHGHHTLETLSALARFRDVPALFVCHDSITWHSVPPISPRIRRWVAVDRNCRDRMAFEYAIPFHSIDVLLNAVDLERFTRRPPLPAKPRRALVFSNQAAANNWAAPIQAACSERGISLDVIGAAAGRVTESPESILTEYDLVFGKARCALEAAAVGTAVIACDARGLAGMITSESLEGMRQLNFGMRTLQHAITSHAVGAEIDRYDAADATAVCDRMRSSAGIDLLADQYIALYEELCGEDVRTSPEQELEDFGRSLARISRPLYGPPGGAFTGPWPRVRQALLNSKTLAAPARFLYRIRKRLQF